jgi:hypothetical protein
VPGWGFKKKSRDSEAERPCEIKRALAGMPDFKINSSARYFSGLGLGALFPFKLPWVETVGQAARLTGSLAKAMHGPCAIFVRRVAALSEPYAT